MNDLEGISKEEDVKNFYLTKQRIEANKPISQEAGNAFFTTNLELLAKGHDPAEMKEICRLLAKAIENGYDASVLKQKKYEDIFREYGWCL